MRAWLRQLDGILRGEATRPEVIQKGRLDVSARGQLLVMVIFGLLFGACVGAFAVIRTGGGAGRN